MAAAGDPHGFAAAKIAIDGIPLSGKSTLMDLMHGYIRSHRDLPRGRFMRRPALCTDYLTDTALTRRQWQEIAHADDPHRALRRLLSQIKPFHALLDTILAVGARNSIMLYDSAYVETSIESYAEVVLPVLTDRGILSRYERALLTRTCEAASPPRGPTSPEIIIFVKTSPQVAYERAIARRGPVDEAYTLDYLYDFANRYERWVMNSRGKDIIQVNGDHWFDPKPVLKEVARLLAIRRAAQIESTIVSWD